jgi:hypothetical protein
MEGNPTNRSDCGGPGRRVRIGPDSQGHITSGFYQAIYPLRRKDTKGPRLGPT